MKVNMNKAKVMISGEPQKVMQKTVRWPCGVSGVGNNSIQCTSWRYVALVIVLWHPSLSLLSSASVTALR